MTDASNRAVSGKMRVLDLFSGIGGFSLGLERAGMRTVAFCEIEPFPRAVLRKHWPNVPCYDDIRTLTAKRLSEDGITADVICGGFPCQDISIAGTWNTGGVGIAGERSGLWFEYLRLIGEIGPRFVIVENVAALLERGLCDILAGLAQIGYDAEWHCIPASAVGAPQIRDRMWLVAYPEQKQWVCPIFHANDVAEKIRLTATERRKDGIRPKVGGTCRSIPGSWMDQPDSVGVADGVPAWSYRLAALGNAVVPQIPEIIGRAIMEAHHATRPI